ncbi:FecR family protein [Sphingobacterium faecale]|uniref:FecR domain-containing protein n=1 Tax=Sphingobacterium faecale TaxID=2803775 RepID=A0ABS1R591_9SPHI|nr:FecR domain-containing protein [Sphingobacterium faecale]MBL1409016.1 FecR domain-containing protein [Sphingobacterium faecale]
MKESIDILFQRYLDGTYTVQDLDVLLQYFKLDEPDAAFEQRILAELKRDIDLERETAVRRLADDIGARLLEKIKDPYRIRRGQWIGRVAAAVLLFGLMGIGIFYYNQRDKAENTTTMSSKYGDEVLPGGMHASVTSDDGSEVVLDENYSGIIVGEDLIYKDGTSVGVRPTKHATLKTPRGGQYQLTLADGTSVWLNAASSLKYPTSFGNAERVVELDGEAYFEVTHQPDKPFVVVSQGQRVKVLGTTFNISTYKENRSTITTLIHGRVEVENTKSEQKQILKPGQQTLISSEAMKIITIDDVADYAAWKDGYYIRTGVKLEEVLPELERWYDVQFELKELPPLRAYVALSRNAKLSEVLDALTLNYGVKFKVDGRRVVIM